MKNVSLALSVCFIVSIMWLTPAGAIPHSFLSAYDGPSTCLGCHATSQTSPVSLEEVMGTVHYQMRGLNERVGFPGGGSHGMLDRACGLRGTNTLINYDSSCGQCHIGKGLPFPDPETGEPTAAQMDGIDCLICHAVDYDMNADTIYDATDHNASARVRVADPAFGEVWSQDRSLRAARTVGDPIGKDQCLRCHEHGLNSCSFKRGAPFEPERDVHAEAGMNCTECHTVSQHQIARGSRVTDMMAWERHDTEVACANDTCHGPAPHTTRPILNDHYAHLTCETCHIPYAAGVERQIWAPTFGVTEGPEANVPIFNSETGKYEPYINLQLDPLTAPVYKWFSGESSMLAEPMADAQAFDMVPADRDTPGARIQPFRNLVNGMIMDKNGIPAFPDGMGGTVPNPNFNPAYTMAGAFQAAATTYIQMGFMRPEGLSATEEAFLAQIPNLLLFDQPKYFDTGDIAAAVNLGMGKVGAMFGGMHPGEMTEEQLMGIGATMWSGECVGMDMPDNPLDPAYVPDMDPTTAVGSFITISHGVTRENALQCADCHSEEGRLDFEKLGYSPEDQARLSSVPHDAIIEQMGYNGPSTCLTPGCHGAGGSIEITTDEIHSGVHYKFESELPPGYQFDEAGAEVTFATSGKLWKVCGFPTSLPQFNWVGNLRDLPETQEIDRPGGCGTCHIGIGMKPFTALGESVPAASEDQNIDCLICHAETYNRKYYTAIRDGSPELNGQGMPVILSVPKVDGVLQWDVYTEAAKTVGPTTSNTCLRCHAAAGGGKFQPDDHHYASFKRASLFAEGMDVHYDNGMNCSDCHYAGDHKFKRPLNNDLSAHDVVVDHEMCTDCHGTAPHPAATSMYNDHNQFISCTTCHAQYFGGVTYKDFSQTVPPDPEDPLGIYGVKVEFATPDLGAIFTWFNGTVEPEIKPRGSRGDGKIYPYKPAAFKQPLDADGHPIPLKWGVFFKTGNMPGAIETGRSQYAAMYTTELSENYGLPPVPGPFDHFGFTEHECGGFSISHSITKTNALRCASCHNPNSILEFEKLGYDEDETARLENLLDLPPLGDLNGDRIVDHRDLYIFQQYWHRSQDEMLKAMQKVK